MMRLSDSATIAMLEISDVTGQKRVTVDDVPPNHTVGELIEGLLSELRLARNDSAGRPLTYHARLEREGRHLHATEVIGDALQPGDRLTLQPNIDAGMGVR